MKHPHSAFITEAMQDMSREFECSGNNGLNWSHSDLVSLICAGETWQFRFKPTRPAVVSTLSDDELYDARMNCNDGDPDRVIANAAAAAERARICSLPAVSDITILAGSYSYAKLKSITNSAIAQFQRDLM